MDSASLQHKRRGRREDVQPGTSRDGATNPAPYCAPSCAPSTGFRSCLWAPPIVALPSEIHHTCARTSESAPAPSPSPCPPCPHWVPEPHVPSVEVLPPSRDPPYIHTPDWMPPLPLPLLFSGFRSSRYHHFDWWELESYSQYVSKLQPDGSYELGEPLQSVIWASPGRRPDMNASHATRMVSCCPGAVTDQMGFIL